LYKWSIVLLCVCDILYTYRQQPSEGLERPLVLL